MEKKRLLWLIPLILLLAVLVWAGIFYFILRGRSLELRPLVLLTSPLSSQYVETGKSVGIQAVARSKTGIERMQVWVDDYLLAEKKMTEEEINSPLVIMTNWVPAMSGRHVISVRAFSADGVSGQSTVFVTAEQEVAARHVVQEGETLEVIAASYGVEEAAIIDANAAAGAESPQAGDEVEIPAAGGGSPPFDSWGEEVTPADDRGGGRIGPDGGAGEEDEAPSAAAPEPGSIESMGLFWFADLFQPPTDPIELVIKVLALQTREGYEGLHCYVSLAGSTPTWVPDADMDQSTDETFHSRADGTEWNVGQYLSDTRSTNITWERNTPVPLDISCVGVTDGGLNAVELGRILDEVSPDQWGVPQTARSSGGESQFNLAYLVTYPEKGLDLAMTPPWDVRLHQDASTLSWSYLPEVGGAPAVDGFAIFLNDQLQFTVDGRTHEVDIPPQWFEVPCDNQYRFTVVAFFNTYPEGNFSPPSEAAVLAGGDPGTEGCPLSVTINFQVLNVGNLGNPIPVTAYFIANEQRLTLDGTRGSIPAEESRDSSSRSELFIDESSIPPKLGLEDNHGYRIPSLFYATLSRYGQLLLELPYDDPEDPYDSLQLGFEIYGPDNRLLCGGDLAVSAEDAKEGIIGDIFNEYPQEGTPDLCVVSFDLSPVVRGMSETPLPNLEVQGIGYDNAHGFHVIYLKNTGTADWLNQDLVIEATTPEGEVIDRYTFRNATLEVNEEGQLGDRQFDWEPILGACVQLDPDNNVAEEIDRAVESGFIHDRGRFCPGLPDLVITNVLPLAVSDEVQVRLQNRGEGSAANLIGYGSLPPIDLLVEVYRQGNDYRPDFALTIEDFSLDNWDTGYLYLDIDPDVLDGFTVRVNPDHKVSELDYDNNEFTIDRSRELYIDWIGGDYDFCRAGLGAANDNWTFNFTAEIVGGDYTTPVVSWTKTAVNDYYVGDGFWVDDRAELDSGWFRIQGDESLMINLTAHLKIASYVDEDSHPGTIMLTADENYGDATVVVEGFPPDCMFWTFAYSSSCDEYDLGSSFVRVGPTRIFEPSLNSECYWESNFRIYQRDPYRER